MNGTGNEILACAAFSSDEDGQVVPLDALNLFDDAVHGGAGTDESREQGIERALGGGLRCSRRPVAQAAQLEPLPRDRREHPQSAAVALGHASRDNHSARARTVVIRSERLSE